MTSVRRWGALVVGSCILACGVSAVLAQAPAEVTGVNFNSNKTQLVWSTVAGADDYNVYRGSALQLKQGVPPRCHGDEIVPTNFTTPDPPAVGDAYVYLVTGESNVNGEGTPGNNSAGQLRATLGKCDPQRKHHLLERVTYGWNEYVRDRLNTLGPQGFLNEQLAPATIDESTNSQLNSALTSVTPPENQVELASRQTILAVYARRQLEEVVTEFWNNHFSTDYNKLVNSVFPADAAVSADAQYREMEKFRTDAFTRTFRDMLQDSGLGPAMIGYLDTNLNVVGNPNENYGRELMELHTMGVDGGYTQEDVRQMALVFTGWTLCRKTSNNMNDPLAPCALVGGKYVANFDYTKHDCRQKTLFAGTPQQTIIPATCNGSGQPTTSGVNDAYRAFDAVSNHPSTPRFIGKKLLQKFVTETPSAAMLQGVVDTWTATGGNNLQVLKKVLEYATLTNPDLIHNKVKTPFEFFSMVYRATRADTNPGNLNTLYNYLARLQMLPHQKAEPTGYSELAKNWVNTNDLLERQNFCWDVSTNINFLANIVDLLAANGLTAASPPGDIVDFYSNILVGGALTPAERQQAIDFLTTNDNGVPTTVTNDNINKLVAFMMGMPGSMEQ